MTPSIDFTSSLYLGMRHSSASLEPWAELTTGVPAALREAPGALRIARNLAALVGCEAATLGVSTLHLLLDWCGTQAATQGTVMLWDQCLYPVTKWGVERAHTRGARVQSFEHFSTSSLAAAIARCSRRGLRPVVVTDGYCPGCGRAAPLASYCTLAQSAGGTLLVDDTQALGVMGDPSSNAHAGGGSLRRQGIDGRGVIWVASLAKGFGVPIAALAGDGASVERFERQSAARVHTSPPSAAAIAAAARALSLNRSFGAVRRQRLTARVRQFRAGLAAAGFSTTGELHPMQLLDTILPVTPRALHVALTRRGVQTVLVRPACRSQSALAWLINATHGRDEIDHALGVLVATVRHLRREALSEGAEGERRCRDDII